MQQPLERMTTAELVRIYNDLGPVKRLSSWKQSKTALIQRIHIGQKQHTAVETLYLGESNEETTTNEEATDSEACEI